VPALVWSGKRDTVDSSMERSGAARCVLLRVARSADDRSRSTLTSFRQPAEKDRNHPQQQTFTRSITVATRGTERKWPAEQEDQGKQRQLHIRPVHKGRCTKAGAQRPAHKGRCTKAGAQRPVQHDRSIDAAYNILGWMPCYPPRGTTHAPRATSSCRPFANIPHARGV
jgi:hypothetical protein